jgi:hypothetical protein
MARSLKGRAWLLPLAATVGCGEKVIEMKLTLPDDHAQWDTSCIKTIEVFTEGTNYPTIADDFSGQTLDTRDSPPATYLDVEDAVRGQFDVEIPESGLGGIEMYGWDGSSGFFPDGTFPDMVFFSFVPYTGQDTIRVELVPNLDCRPRPVTIRPIDLITLITTKDCAMAAVTDPQAFASMGTLTPGLFRDYLFGWGGQHGANVVGGVATFQAPTTAGPESCVAVYSSDAIASSGGCVTGERACAMANELEVALVDNVFSDNSVDTAIEEQFRGVIVGAVVDATKTPIAGATVSVDEALGKVVYVNLDLAGARFVPVANAQATTASGMFMLYTSDLVEVNVTAMGRTKPLTLGAQRRAQGGFTLPAGVIVTF